MANVQRFPASLDNTSRVVTTMVVLVLVALAIFFLVNQSDRFEPGPLIVLGAITSLTFVTLLFRPTQYTLTADALHIDRRIGSRRVFLKDIAWAEAVSSKALGVQLRVFGSGGFGGYFGVFRPSALGHNADYYVTNMSRLILIRPRNGRELLISPDDTAGFETALRARLREQKSE